MARDFQFSPKVEALLGQIGLVREMRSICREDGPLTHELRDLMSHLRRELPNLVPGMAGWQISGPYEEDRRYCLDAYPGGSWKRSESEYICFGLSVKSDPTYCSLDDCESPLDNDPWVFLYIPLEWPDRENLVSRLKAKDVMPKGFTDFYPPGNPDETTPIWRYLPLENFASKQGFNVDGLIQEIARSLKELMGVIPVIDGFALRKKGKASGR